MYPSRNIVKKFYFQKIYKQNLPFESIVFSIHGLKKVRYPP